MYDWFALFHYFIAAIVTNTIMIWRALTQLRWYLSPFLTESIMTMATIMAIITIILNIEWLFNYYCFILLLFISIERRNSMIECEELTIRVHAKALSLSVCVRARLFLYKTLRQNNNVTYFFSYFKINHDCLHTLFVNCSKVNGIYVCVCWFVRWLAGWLAAWLTECELRMSLSKCDDKLFSTHTKKFQWRYEQQKQHSCNKSNVKNAKKTHNNITKLFLLRSTQYRWNTHKHTHICSVTRCPIRHDIAQFSIFWSWFRTVLNIFEACLPFVIEHIIYSYSWR